MFYRMVTGDLDEAYRSLKITRRYRKADVIIALVRDAIVAYARPFSCNKGKFAKKLSLSKKDVPKSLQDFHEKVIDFRNQVFAHSDIPFRGPRLGRLQLDSGYIYPISLKGLYYEELVSYIEPLKQLILEVHGSVVEKIKRIENEYF